MTRFLRSFLACALGGSLLAGCVCMPKQNDDPKLAACEETVRQSGIAPYGSHALSIDGKAADARLPRRALAAIGRVVDAPAPNPLHGVAVARCLRASARG